MKTRLLDHIDLRIKDMGVAVKFYAKFLPQLGFVREKHEPAPQESQGEDFHTFYSAGGDKPSEFFGFIEDKNHRPNGTRIAFWAETREKVDRFGSIRFQIGRTINFCSPTAKRSFFCSTNCRTYWPGARCALLESWRSFIALSFLPKGSASTCKNAGPSF